MPRIADALSPRQYQGTPVSEMATAASPTYAQQAARIPGRIMDAFRALGAGQTYGTAEPTNSISDLARARLGRGSVFGVPEDVQQRNVDRAMEAASIAAPIKRAFSAPQDAALRLAQERAALPVEQGGLGLPPNNTAEQRAAAMGFNKTAYHATDADILTFDNAKLGTNTAYLTGGDEDAIKSAMRGHWFSDRDLTNKDPRGYMFGNVSYPVKLANPKIINDKEFHSKSFIVKDPDNIRSRFAAFDPFRRNAAIAAAMGVAAPDLLAQERTKIKDLAKTK